jgi:uncharacterized membrane protein HdeD (DUF308 family)
MTLTRSVLVTLLFLVSAGFIFAGARAPWSAFTDRRLRALGIVYALVGIVYGITAFLSRDHTKMTEMGILSLLTACDFLVAGVLFIFGPERRRAYRNETASVTGPGT